MTESPSRPKGSARTLVLIIALMALFVGLFSARIFYHRPTAEKLLEDGVRLFSTPRSFSSFALLDQQGKPFGPEQLRGKWNLLFFGFTHCPGVCPATMSELGIFARGLTAAHALDTQVLMVSVDPERDTPERMGRYVANFSPDFIGLTGSSAAIRSFVSQFNVVYERVDGEQESYEVEHSAHVVVVGPQGLYRGIIYPPIEAPGLGSAYADLRRFYRSLPMEVALESKNRPKAAATTVGALGRSQ